LQSSCAHHFRHLNLDSNFRIAQANHEKERLEAKQRQERDAAEAAGQPWQPRWFEKV
jgi:hypothetical protein